ncbi:hypothetical protein [Methylobacterium sp. Gmos1]
MPTQRHSKLLHVFRGARLDHAIGCTPPYTPELQPAETLWPLVDEPVVNRHIANLDELERAVEQRCVTLSDQPDVIRSRTSFRWLPKTAKTKLRLV